MAKSKRQMDECLAGVKAMLQGFGEYMPITQIMQVLKMLPLIYFQLRVYCNALLCTTNTMSRSSGTLRRHFEDGKYVVFGQCLFGILYT